MAEEIPWPIPKPRPDFYEIIINGADLTNIWCLLKTINSAQYITERCMVLFKFYGLYYKEMFEIDPILISIQKIPITFVLWDVKASSRAASSMQQQGDVRGGRPKEPQSGCQSIVEEHYYEHF